MRRIEGTFIAILAGLVLVIAAPAQAQVCGNGMLELPAEQCDLTDDFACPGQCQLDCFCPLNHFQCYETKRRQFTPVPRTVEDQFGTATGNVERAERFCRPANKENEEPGAETEPDHLVGYRFRHPFTKVRNQELVNQFAGPGEMVVDVTRPLWLLTPSLITLGPQPPVIDHFQCYKIKRSRGTPKFVPRTVTVTDASGTFDVMVRKPQYLCAPADKNGEDPGAETHVEHLVCFKGRTARLGTIENQFVDNQFGPLQQLDIIRRLELCLPTLKNTLGSTTTSSSTVTTTSTAAPTTTTSTTAAPPTTAPTTTTTSSTTTTTLYGSPSRAFLDRTVGLLD